MLERALLVGGQGREATVEGLVNSIHPHSPATPWSGRDANKIGAGLRDAHVTVVTAEFLVVVWAGAVGGNLGVHLRGKGKKTRNDSWHGECCSNQERE